MKNIKIMERKLMKDWLNQEYLNKSFTYDDIKYNIKYRVSIIKPPEVPKILMVSFQPNKRATELTKLFIDSVKKFTDTPFELWVIDDNSPIENLEWMDELENVNLAFIRTEPKERGSYSNGIAIEVGSRLIDPESQYVATFHSDTIVCRQGWLNFLLSKIDDKTRASGFRLTKERVSEGVLHVCGYLIDFQLYKKLNLSFMPEFPAYDIGDKLIHEFLKNGYQIFAAPNTFDNPELVSSIAESLEMHNLNTTRALNDKNEVVYMHLGRGILKAVGKYKNNEKSSSEQWVNYIKGNLFSEPQLQFVEEKGTEEFDFLRYSINEFYYWSAIRNILDLFKSGSKIIGFDTERLLLEVFKNKINFLKLEGLKEKDCDCIISPIIKNNKVLKGLMGKFTESLRPGGVLLILGNGNPEFGLIDKLWGHGYREIRIKKNGSFENIKLVKQIEDIKKKGSTTTDRILAKLINGKFRRIIKKDNTLSKKNPFNGGTAIGYILLAVK